MADTPKKPERGAAPKPVPPAKLDPECSALLREFNLSPEAFTDSGCDWDLLKRIRTAHRLDTENLLAVANAVADLLRQVSEVHSLKVRVKHADHLVAKVIRKRLEDRASDVTDANYRQRITDLVGIRALHLFKNEWRPIHEFVKAHWDLLEQPTAYIREGDSKESFEECGCRVETHAIGYRSVHYLLKSQPTKVENVVELQVRTLFEEGWSEIDHRTRYPYGLGDPVLSQFSRIFNLLAGGADEMGTFVRVLYQSIEQHKLTVAAREAELRETISKLKLEEKAKAKLQRELDDYVKSSRTVVAPGFTLGTALEKYTIAGGTNYGFDAATFKLPQYGSIIGATNKVCSKCGKDYLPSSFDVSGLTTVNLCPDCRKGPFSIGP